MGFRQHGATENEAAFEDSMVRAALQRIASFITSVCEVEPSSGADGEQMRKVEQSLRRAYQTPRIALRLVRKGRTESLKREIAKYAQLRKREIENDVHDKR